MLSKLYPPWIGGLESHVAHLSHAVTAIDSGVRVSVVTGQVGRARMTTEENGGVRVLRATTLGRVVRTPITLGTRSLIRHTQPDLVHFHSPNPWTELVAPLDERGVRVIVTYYHDVIRQKKLFRVYCPILDRLLRRADRIVVWSHELALTSPVLHRYRDKIAVIPGGIETSRFLPSARSRQQAQEMRRVLVPEGPVVLFVGRLVYYKGIEFLISAMRDVRATLLIVGRGELDETLHRLVRRLGLGSRIRFFTDVGDAELPLYFQASDLLVLPSCETTETFGLVQLEAHASGIPSICTALPSGVTFVNLDGVTGLVVPPRNAERLAEAINELLSDPRRREDMGRRAQQRSVELFDISRCASEMVQLYRELVPSRSGNVM